MKTILPYALLGYMDVRGGPTASSQNGGMAAM